MATRCLLLRPTIKTIALYIMRYYFIILFAFMCGNAISQSNETQGTTNQSVETSQEEKVKIKKIANQNDLKVKRVERPVQPVIKNEEKIIEETLQKKQ